MQGRFRPDMKMVVAKEAEEIAGRKHIYYTETI
jgi:hypothetical protein